ncbi:hypothetical protein BHF71_08895 [Vulcanibacillus modesticaldus]|uniref:Inner membrane protein YgaP-like transmembrane domain-containing protein n=1 Tax=Vulcanibacillus modesticaldus TaxID=337097 RepID=A0A1D2YUT7_9BACI|nr:DUF2892 domain-containing protein [Vulcanibacillus modesticaldus]OEF99470.1 hypothetical protein BHF71_08895 [Vulcanibacillus modesticaldus]
MKKNVGTVDALLRITWGLFGLAWGISRMTRYPHRGLPVIVTIIASLKVAEGITRWCPMLDILGITTIEKTANLKRVKMAKEMIQPLE